MQGLLKLGQSREDKSKRVTLCVDEADISFALQVWRQILCLLYDPPISVFSLRYLGSLIYIFIDMNQGIRFFRNCLQ